MVDTIVRPDAGLPEVLAARARASSVRRLALDVTIGAAAAVVLLAWRPPLWPTLLSGALCFVAFGAWGLADRRMQAAEAAFADLAPPDATTHAALWHAVRGTAALLGGVAALALFATGLFGMLGTWIS